MRGAHKSSTVGREEGGWEWLERVGEDEARLVWRRQKNGSARSSVGSPQTKSERIQTPPTPRPVWQNACSELASGSLGPPACPSQHAPAGRGLPATHPPSLQPSWLLYAREGRRHDFSAAAEVRRG